MKVFPKIQIPYPENKIISSSDLYLDDVKSLADLCVDLISTDKSLADFCSSNDKSLEEEGKGKLDKTLKSNLISHSIINNLFDKTSKPKGLYLFYFKLLKIKIKLTNK